MIPDVV